jgi:hypothetical protein
MHGLDGAAARDNMTTIIQAMTVLARHPEISGDD